MHATWRPLSLHGTNNMKDSKIEWTHHTFNPWIGCQKVSPGCQHCYAEALMDRRYQKAKWGPQGTRKRTSPAYWRQPLAWNRQAAAEGRLHRVFCASLADVFEDRSELEPWRRDLLILMEETPYLSWLLLTKRPENIMPMVEKASGMQNAQFWFEAMHRRVWIGTSVENQAAADERIPHLLNVPAKIHFLSCEPLLGPIDLWGAHYKNPYGGMTGAVTRWPGGVDWVIAGGESGPHARPMHPGWVRSLRDQCQAAGVPFLFKQWGEYASVSEVEGAGAHHTFEDGATVRRVGKHNAGRTLDGCEWNEFPC